MEDMVNIKGEDNMDYVYIGKIVDTHGIKGELRIRSNFDKKDIVYLHLPDIYAFLLSYRNSGYFQKG